MLDTLRVTPHYIENSASIVYSDCMVYEDAQREKVLTVIKWGNLTPSENKTYVYYVVNHKKLNAVFEYSVSNWLPIEAKDFISFEVTPINAMFKPQEMKLLNFTLKIAPNISNITTFSFNINVNMN